MKVILMAAGLGTRISKRVNKPKSTLEIEDTTIIRRAIKIFLDRGFDVAVVVGYKKEDIFNELEGLDVTYYENPFYRVTNSMGSLWCAKDFIDTEDDLILTNADVFWEEPILDALLEDKRGAVMLADSSRVAEGDFFFKREGDRLVDFGKELAVEDRDCEYVGIAKISKNNIKGFYDRLVSLVEEEDYNKWWENVLYEYLDEHETNVLDIEGYFWGEVDTFEEYQIILDFIKSNPEKVKC